MALLIPDARHGLLGGLVADASLLQGHPPSLKDAVERYRRLRADDAGWMIGRFMIPASRLEDLAGLLVRTMAHGETPWRVATVFDDGGHDASIAASYHETMDPAAPIDIVCVREPSDRSEEQAVASLVAAGGVHADAVPMLITDVGESPVASLDTVARVRVETLRPAGVCLNLEAQHDPELLVTTIDRCVRDDVPLAIGPASLPAVTVNDRSSSMPRYGALNVLGIILQARAAVQTDRMELLLDDDPESFEVGFAGMRWRGATIGSGSPLGRGRDPLLSIGSFEPDSTISEAVAAV